MELSEILQLSQGEEFVYPDIFDDSIGLDLKDEEQGTHAVKTWGYVPTNLKRRVELEITTYRGISSDAEHYYGKLKIQGVNMEFNDRPGVSTFGDESKNPLYGYKYELDLKRRVTLEDKEKDLMAICPAEVKWDGYKVGYPTERFNSREELIEFAKLVFETRFKGEWEFKIIG